MFLMRFLRGVVFCFMSAFLSCSAITAQDAATKPETSCTKDRSVDEYLAELNKRQKGPHNPLPNNVCIFGMCAHTGVGPGDKKRTEEETTASEPGPPVLNRRTAEDNGESSSKKENAEVAGTIPPSASTYDPVTAAHDVGVGDYYFSQKNYRGALMRYTDANREKPGDAAIHVRLGRGWEKLGSPEQAYPEYDAAVKLEPEGKSAAEAKDAMERLRPVLQKAAVDPAALVAGNEPEKAPCLPGLRSR
jgi:tetratricopeptide (TPR) repeat protein